MKPDAKAGDLFAAAVPRAVESFEYRVVAGDGRSQAFRVDVVKRPRVESIALDVHAPGLHREEAAHGARLRRRDHRPRRHLRSPSTLKASKPLKEAAFVTEKGETSRSSEARPTASRAGSALASVGSTVDGPTRYQIKLLDTDGYESADPLWRSIAATRDQPPVVTISEPGRDLQVKPGAVVPIAVDARDDYGVGAVRLVYRVNDETTVAELAAFPHDGAPVARDERSLRLDPLRPELKPGALVQYWAVASDRNNVTGPGTSESRRFSLFITTPEQAVARLDMEISDYAKMLESLVRLQKENRRRPPRAARSKRS